MIWIAILFGIVAIAVAIFQRLFVGLYGYRTHQQLRRENDTDYQPRTALILCLRGADPSLRRCLSSIENQSYSNFELHLVVDDPADPALAVVNEFLSQSKLTATTHCIQDRDHPCSLKCMAIATAIHSLPESIEAVAMIDADSIVTPSWLGTLLAPLADPEVGAATGNRWFRATSPTTIGSQVRGVWNAAAVVQMYLYEIPWGGSLALRTEVIQQANLVEHWLKGFCEDTMLTSILHQEGYRIARPPELIVVNEESTSILGAYRWLHRQLLTVRLHHPRWPLIWLHGIATGLPMLGLLLAAVSAGLGSFYTTAVLLILVVMYQLAGVLALTAIVRAHRPLLRHGAQPIPTGRELILYSLAMPLTQLLHFIATLQTTRVSRVRWRGIQYRLKGKKVQMVEYVPYADLDASVSNADQNSSSASIQ